MTECERIINEGILPKSFFEEEERCGFFIDVKRKKLWAILLDLLLEIDHICTENNLTYYLSSGTLLGAIRHKGFIPWDDDIDIAMPREDYEKLQCLSDTIKRPYLLQTPYTDNGYFQSYIKFRNVNTTFVSEMLIRNEYNQGCFIDIFPYDRFDNDSSNVLFDRVKLLARSLGVVLKASNPKFVNNDKEIESILHDMTPIQIYEEIQSLCKNAGSVNSKFETSLTSTLTRYEKKAYPIECVNETIRMPFEMFQFPVPIGYETILRQLFGDYMQFPPIEKRGNQHSGFIYEPDITFGDFKRQYLL